MEMRFTTKSDNQMTESFTMLGQCLKRKFERALDSSVAMLNRYLTTFLPIYSVFIPIQSL